MIISALVTVLIIRIWFANDAFCMMSILLCNVSNTFLMKKQQAAAKDENFYMLTWTFLHLIWRQTSHQTRTNGPSLKVNLPADSQIFMCEQNVSRLQTCHWKNVEEAGWDSLIYLATISTYHYSITLRYADIMWDILKATPAENQFGPDPLTPSNTGSSISSDVTVQFTWIKVNLVHLSSYIV